MEMFYLAKRIFLCFVAYFFPFFPINLLPKFVKNQVVFNICVVDFYGGITDINKP